MSNTLMRLRAVMDDELFVREGKFNVANNLKPVNLLVLSMQF